MTMTENSPVCLSMPTAELAPDAMVRIASGEVVTWAECQRRLSDDGPLPSASRPSVPTEGVTASGDETEGQRAVRKVRLWIKCGMPDQSDNTPSLSALRRDLNTVLSLVENSPSPALGGNEAKRSHPNPSPSPEPVKDQAEQGVETPRCQLCGGRIEGWICQTCEADFEEVGGLLIVKADNSHIALQKREAGLRAEIAALTVRLNRWEPKAYCPPSVSSSAQGDQT